MLKNFEWSRSSEQNQEKEREQSGSGANWTSNREEWSRSGARF